jgi:hypothetical protein
MALMPPFNYTHEREREREMGEREREREREMKGAHGAFQLHQHSLHL